MSARALALTLVIGTLAVADGYRTTAFGRPRSLAAAQPRSVAGWHAEQRPVMMIGRPEDEPDEAFISTWEQKPDGEKIKSPVVIGGLAALLIPFLIGILVLATGGGQ